MLPEQAIEISKVRFDHAKECLRDANLLLAGESYAVRQTAHTMRFSTRCAPFLLLMA